MPKISVKTENKYCSKCGKALNVDDKASGKCRSCGQPIKNSTKQDVFKLYDLYLESYENNKEKCVALISEVLSVDTDSAKSKIENMPIAVLHNCTEAQVKALSKRFTKLQAKVVIKAHPATQQQCDAASKNPLFNTNVADMGDNTSDIEYVEPRKKEKTNKVADKFEIIGGAIIALGVICGIILGIAAKSFIVFIAVSVVYFVFGMIFIGFSEIIQLLDDIKNK